MLLFVPGARRLAVVSPLSNGRKLKGLHGKLQKTLHLLSSQRDVHFAKCQSLDPEHRTVELSRDK